MTKILAYGSLRKGQYNFDRIASTFGAHSIKFIESKTIEGFKLYTLGPYPAIYPGKGTVACDLLEVNDEAAEFIQYMELGAGYEEKNIDEARIYIYRRPIPKEKEIISGDWIAESTVK